MLKLLECNMDGAWFGRGLTENGNAFSSTYYTRNIDHVMEKTSEGTVVLDKTPVTWSKGANLAVKGPLLDVKIPPDSVQHMDGVGKRVLGQMAPALEGEYKGIASLALAGVGVESFGMLDSVGLNIYVGLWRDIGARIGKVLQDGTIEWENQIELPLD